jgi:hypothetical protein
MTFFTSKRINIFTVNLHIYVAGPTTSMRGREKRGTADLEYFKTSGPKVCVWGGGGVRRGAALHYRISRQDVFMLLAAVDFEFWGSLPQQKAALPKSLTGPPSVAGATNFILSWGVKQP